MKILVVIAVAVFTGCQASVIRQDEAKPSIEMVKDAFWDYVSKATLTTEEILQKIKESEMGQEVNTRISESGDAINQYAVAVSGQVTPLTQELLAKMSQEAEQLKARLQQDISSVKTQLEPYIEELTSDIQQQVEQWKKDMAPYTDAQQSEALRAALLQKNEELKMSLEKSMSELQAKLGPQADELDKHLQDFQKNIALFVQNSEKVPQTLDPYAQDLKAQLTALWESFTKNIQ
ncbi:apolipoprotein A-I [Pangasianodon hypophthalmus]|uniref:apolipoprotein A-I n=1 Tax=Pangasianodon hypophthalmus TaxID=310915 RepID=UPI000F00C283|nr:apolipoprotein A-I [Pangasianodon hypophthalmus]XP_026798162.3 apolipoprotein A-I [Pangasianodon hypophthalmus]XP_053087200.1 apolipoprotein A-I [Pangasianodon hypophthalmus]